MAESLHISVLHFLTPELAVALLSLSYITAPPHPAQSVLFQVFCPVCHLLSCFPPLCYYLLFCTVSHLLSCLLSVSFLFTSSFTLSQTLSLRIEKNPNFIRALCNWIVNTVPSKKYSSATGYSFNSLSVWRAASCEGQNGALISRFMMTADLVYQY